MAVEKACLLVYLMSAQKKGIITYKMHNNSMIRMLAVSNM